VLHAYNTDTFLRPHGLRRDGRRLRLLVRIGPEYRGFTAGVVWEKAEVGLGTPSLLRLFDGYALVTDLGWLREWTHVMGFLMPFPLRVFGLDQTDEAMAWLRALPEGPGVTHRLLPESGVIVVEVSEPLRAPDFDALAVTADGWLDTHDAVPGIVIHARELPGWDHPPSSRPEPAPATHPAVTQLGLHATSKLCRGAAGHSSGREHIARRASSTAWVLGLMGPRPHGSSASAAHRLIDRS
jgi:SpoIIAA-like